MKILIVKYLPSGESSNTLQLLNHFKTSVNGHSIEEIDLIQNPPPFFDIDSMTAYKLRNFGGQELNSNLQAAIKPMDKLTEQFILADLVVLATPMHNFSLPGLVKLYFDAIMQSGKVFKYENNEQLGLMRPKKFLTLYTSMGSYQSEYGYLDNLKTIVKIELDFMGLTDHKFVSANTGNEHTKKLQLEKAFSAISKLHDNWMY